MKSQKLLKTIRPAEGANVCLEPFSLRRLREFCSLYLCNRSKWEQFLVLHFKNLNEIESFITQQSRNDKFTGYFIVEKSSGKLIGFILGDELEHDGICRTRAIAAEFEGRGYAFEAAQLFEKIVKEAGYEAVILSCDSINKHVKELALRGGYQKIKTQKFTNGPVSMDLDIYIKILQ